MAGHLVVTEEPKCTRCGGSGVDPMTGWAPEIVDHVLCLGDHPACDECDGRGRPLTEDEEAEAFLRFCAYAETGHPPRC